MLTPTELSIELCKQKHWLITIESYQFYQSKHQSETITFLLMAGHDNTSLQKTSVVLHTTDFSK